MVALANCGLNGRWNFTVFCEKEGVFVLHFSRGRRRERKNWLRGKVSPIIGHIRFLLNPRFGRVVFPYERFWWKKY